MAGPPPVVSDNRPDTGPGARARRALTWSGEPQQEKVTMTPQPTDKLDAATTVVVNGPADDPPQAGRIVRCHANGPAWACLSRMR